MTTDERNQLRAVVADVLELELEPLFDPRCRLTFVMRAPHLKDGDLVVSNDEIPLALKALERLNGYKTEPVVETTEPVTVEPDAHLGAVEGRD